MRIHPSDNLPCLNVSTDWQRIGDGLETRPVPVRMLNDYYLSIDDSSRENYGSRRWSAHLVLFCCLKIDSAMPCRPPLTGLDKGMNDMRFSRYR